MGSRVPADFESAGTPSRKGRIVNERLSALEEEIWKDLKEMGVPWAKFVREFVIDAVEGEIDNQTGVGVSEVDADILLILAVKALDDLRAPSLRGRGFRWYAKRYTTNSELLGLTEDEIAVHCRRLRRKGLVVGNDKSGWSLSEAGAIFVVESTLFLNDYLPAR